MTPPVLKVISCDCVSLHPGLGVMDGVECFRVFAQRYINIYLFDFLCIMHRLHQAVVDFPCEQGLFTLADKLRTDQNKIEGEIW